MSHDPYNQQPFDPYAAYNQTPQPQLERPTFPSRHATIRVEELLVIPTGTYQEQFRRPFITDLNNNNMSQVYDVVGEAYRNFKARKDSGALPDNAEYSIDPMTLAPVSASFILPAAGAEAPARLNLNHSLQYQTARFVLRILVQRHGAVEPQRYVMIGYTSHMGLIKKSGRAGLNQSDFTLDPQMQMTINTVMEVRRVERNYGHGAQATWEMQSVHQVLIDAGFKGADEPDVIRMRPYEVAATLSRMNDPNVRRPGVTVNDTRSVQTIKAEFSDVHNTNPNNYMAKIISGLTAGRDMAVQTSMNGAIAPYVQAGRLLRDPIGSEDPFLKAIANFGDGVATATFKFRDLCAIDPNAEHDQICHINMRDYNAFKGHRGQNMASWSDTAPWYARDLATQWAVQITNMLPPIMMDLTIRRVELFASNIHRERICVATNGVPFVQGVDLSPQMRALSILFFEQFIRPMAGDDNHHSYDMDIVADLYGDLAINISIDGKPKIPYVMPAFMSSAMAPVLTSKVDTLDHIATQFHNLQSTVLPPIQPLQMDLAHQHTPSGNRY